MSTFYNINFTDPESPSIDLASGKLDGPGKPASSTSLMLHGRGYTGWGEAVNENFIRLLENFMGATAPVNPVGGQLWIDVTLYHRNTTGPVFYKYDIDPTSGTYKTWVTLSVTSQGTAPAGSVGQYWFDTINSTLNLFASAYDGVAPSWMPRSMSTDTIAPSGTPRQYIRMFDANLGASGEWVDITPRYAYVSDSAAAPEGDVVGSIRFSTTDNMFYIWNGTSWEPFTTGWGLGSIVSDSTATPPNDITGTLRYSPTENLFYIWNGTSWEPFTTGWGVGAYVSADSGAPPNDLVGAIRYNPLDTLFYAWNGDSWDALNAPAVLPPATAGSVYTIQSTSGFWYNGSVNVKTVKWNQDNPTSFYNQMVDITNAAYRDHPLYNAAKWYSTFRYAPTLTVRNKFEWTAPTATRVMIDASGGHTFASTYTVAGAAHIRIEKYVGSAWVYVAEADDGSWYDVTKTGGVPNGYLSVNAGSEYTNKLEKKYKLVFPGAEAAVAYNQDGTVFDPAWKSVFPPFEANVPHRIIVDCYFVSTSSSISLSQIGGSVTFTLIGEGA